jgi:hypothetical protein
VKEADIDRLLETLDKASRQQAYPAYGLNIWGTASQRELLRLEVQDWLETIKPESQR